MRISVGLEILCFLGCAQISIAFLFTFLSAFENISSFFILSNLLEQLNFLTHRHILVDDPFSLFFVDIVPVSDDPISMFLLSIARFEIRMNCLVYEHYFYWKHHIQRFSGKRSMRIFKEREAKVSHETKIQAQKRMSDDRQRKSREKTNASLTMVPPPPRKRRTVHEPETKRL